MKKNSTFYDTLNTRFTAAKNSLEGRVSEFSQILTLFQSYGTCKLKYALFPICNFVLIQKLRNLKVANAPFLIFNEKSRKEMVFKIVRSKELKRM